MRTGTMLGLGLLAALTTGRAAAQDVITLQGGTAAAPAVSGNVMSVRELPDGRLLIATSDRGLVLRVDPRRQRVDTILRAGGVEIPPQVAAMGMPAELMGATLGYIAVASPASGLVFVNPVDPSAPQRFTATGDTVGRAAAPRVPLQTTLVGVDAAGNRYVTAVGLNDPMAVMGGAPQFAPTVPLLRLRPGSSSADTVATVANVAAQSTRQRQEMTDTEIRILVRPADGTPADGLAIFEDGSVGIFSGADYRLRRIAADGSEQRFDPLPRLNRPTTEAMRQASIDSTAKVAAMTLKFMDGMMQQMMSQMGEIPEEAKAMMPKISVVVDTVAPFAEVLPPFTGVMTTVGDRAWLAVPADLLGRTAHYDVVRSNGTLVGRVRAPEGEYIAAVSATAVYTTGGPNGIMRYAMPAARR